MTARDILPPRDEFAVLLGGRIRAARLEAGLSQPDLERASGIDPTAISRYENGHVLPSARALAVLAIALDTSANTLLGLPE